MNARVNFFYMAWGYGLFNLNKGPQQHHPLRGNTCEFPNTRLVTSANLPPGRERALCVSQKIYFRPSCVRVSGSDFINCRGHGLEDGCPNVQECGPLASPHIYNKNKHIYLIKRFMFPPHNSKPSNFPYGIIKNPMSVILRTLRASSRKTGFVDHWRNHQYGIGFQ